MLGIADAPLSRPATTLRRAGSELFLHAPRVSESAALAAGLLCRPRPPDAVINEPELRHLGWTIDIAQIDQHGLLHHRFDAVEIERAELLPFGDDHQRVGVLGARIRAVGE